MGDPVVVDPDEAGPEAAAPAELDEAGVAELLGAGLGWTLAAELGSMRATLGEATTTALGSGDGVGCSPARGGPTKTRAARMPIATRIPATSPATIVTADLMAREGTSPNGPRATSEGRC